MWQHRIGVSVIFKLGGNWMMEEVVKAADTYSGYIILFFIYSKHLKSYLWS